MYAGGIDSIFGLMGLDKEIKRITDNLMGKITSGPDSFTPKDLLSAGIPSQIIEHIRNSVELKILQDLKPPSSKWLDMDHPLMRKAWADFIGAAVSNSCIPKKSLRTAINNSVKEIFPIFIQPRNQLTHFIFGEEDELPYDELVERTNQLTVYKHFASAIPLYMKKRSLDTLTRKRCSILIHNLDEKLVSTYTAIHWGQKLDLLFRMYDNQVDTLLLAIFYKDKRMDKVADFFEDMTGTITKEEFVQILTSPEDAQRIMMRFKSKAKEDEEIINREVDTLSQVDEKEQGLIDSFFGNYEYQPLNEENVKPGDTLAEKLKENVLSNSEMDELVEEIKTKQDSDDDDLDEESVSGQSEKSAIEPEHRKSHKEGVQSDSISSVLQQAASSLQRLEEDEQYLSEEKDDEVVMEVSDSGDITMDDDASTSSGSVIAEEENAEEGGPVWKQFLTDDHINMVVGDKKSGDEEKSAGGESGESGLQAYLSSEKDVLVDELFLGAEYAYDEAMEELSQIKTWKEASGYVQRNIFKRNDIDMTSEIAVEFTNKLQNYFKK